VTGSPTTPQPDGDRHELYEELIVSVPTKPLPGLGEALSAIKSRDFAVELEDEPQSGAYVDREGTVWHWHHHGHEGDRLTRADGSGGNYAAWYVEEQFGPLASVAALAAAETRGWRNAVAALRDDGRLLTWAQLRDPGIFINLKRRDLLADYLDAILGSTGGQP